MRSLRTFEELKDLLSGAKPLPPSKFLSYKLPLSLQQLRELEPLIKDNAQLKGLRLRGCGIDDAGADVLSSSIAFNTTLERLELPSNSITGAGAMFFCNALRSFNSTLRALDLHDNPCLAVELDTMTEIAHHLARNTSRAVRAASPQSALSPFRIREVSCLVVPEGPCSPPDDPLLLESRVLHLESDLSVQTEEIENLKQLGEELTGWKNQLDVASGQMAQVLEMLKSEIDELKERASALERGPRAAAAMSAGPESAALVAQMQAQMQGKWEMLRGSLERLEGLHRPGSVQQDTQRLLVEAVEALTKRIEALEHDRISAQAPHPVLEDMRQQTQALEGQIVELRSQQQALEASTVPASQLAAVQQEVQEAVAAGPKVEEALSGLEMLRQLVMGISQEVSDTSAAAAHTSQKVAALADTCMQLQQQMARQQDLEAVVERLTAETSIIAVSAAAASSSARTVVESQAELQQQVGKLQLDVSTLEHELDTLNAPVRFTEHEGRLQQLQTSQEALEACFADQLGSQAGRLQSAEQQLAAVEAQSREVYEALGTMQAALEVMEAGLQEQPGQWQEEVRSAVQPLLQQLEQQEWTVSAAAAVDGGASSQASHAAAAVSELCMAPSEQPHKWQAAVELAVAPLQQHLFALEAQQAAGSKIAQAAQEAAATLRARLDGAEASIASAQASMSGLPAQWGAAVEGAVGPLQQQHAAASEEVQARIAEIGGRVAAMEAGLTGLQSSLGELPSEWRADLDRAVQPLGAVVAVLQEQQVGDAQGLKELAAEVASDRGYVEGMIEAVEDTIGKLQVAAASMPRQWQCDIQGALEPVLTQVTVVQEQQAEAARQLAALQEGLSRQGCDAAAQLGDLQAALGQQPELWADAVAEAVGPLQEQLASLQAQQVGGMAEALAVVQAAVDKQTADWRAAVRSMAQQVRELEAVHVDVAGELRNVAEQAASATSALETLQATMAQQPAQWQQAVQEAVAPLAAAQASGASALGSLGERVSEIQAQTAGTDAAIAGLLAAVNARQGVATQALAGLQASLEGVAAQLGSAEAAVTEIQQVQDQQTAEAQARVEEAAGQLRGEMEALAAGQSEAEASAQAIGAHEEPLQEQHGLLEQRMASAEARLEGGAASSDLARLQQELAAQLSSLQEAIPPRYNDVPLGSRVEGLEAALGAFQPDAPSAAAGAEGAGAEGHTAAPEPQHSLGARLAGLLRTVAAIQSAMAAAAQRNEAEGQALQKLAAAVRKLGESQAELHCMLEGVGQEQLDLVERVEVLPAIQAVRKEGASPVPSLPKLQSLGQRSPTPTSEGLRSHPLLPAYSSDLESDEEEGGGDQAGSFSGTAHTSGELKELRVHVAVQTKQIIALEAKLAEQAQRHEREFQEMRHLVASAVAKTPGSRARPGSTPLSATLPFMRRSSGGGFLPCDTPLGTAYYDASSEAGDPWDSNPTSPAPTLSLPFMRQQAGSSPWGGSGRVVSAFHAGGTPGASDCHSEGPASPSVASSSADTSFGLAESPFPATVAAGVVVAGMRSTPSHGFLGGRPKLAPAAAEQGAGDAPVELLAAAVVRGHAAAASAEAAAAATTGAWPQGQARPGYTPRDTAAGDLMADITNSSVGRSRSQASEVGAKVVAEVELRQMLRQASSGRAALVKPAAH